MMISSSAYPPDSEAPLKSKIHKHLLANNQHFSAKINFNAAIKFRQLQMSDAEELRMLHEEWFPVRYNPRFYTSACSGALDSFVAVINSRYFTPDPSSSACSKHVPVSLDTGDPDVLQSVLNENPNASTIILNPLEAAHPSTAFDEAKVSKCLDHYEDFIIGASVASLDASVLSAADKRAVLGQRFCIRRPSVYICTKLDSCTPNPSQLPFLFSSLESKSDAVPCAPDPNNGEDSNKSEQVLHIQTVENVQATEGAWNAKKENALRTTVTLRINPIGIAYIHTLGIAEKFRKLGLAKELLRRMIEKFENMELCPKALCLHVIEYNVAAIRLYESLNFVRIKYIREFYRINGILHGSYLYAYYFDGTPPSHFTIFENLCSLARSIFVFGDIFGNCPP